MERVTLGKTGISVSRLCFGTLTMGPLQKKLPLSTGIGLMEAAFTRGVNFLDTAELYQTYDYVRGALRLYPDTVVATKCYAYDEAGAERSFRLAVEGIGREYVDIFLLHEQQSEHTLRGHREALEYLLKRKREGAIGAVGISTHFVSAVRAMRAYEELTVLHPLINMAGIGIADGTREDMEQALGALSETGAGIYSMKPLGGGHLISQREEALSYALSLPYAHSVALGMQSLAEVEYACAVFSGENAPGEVLSRLDTAQRSVLVEDHCTGCGTCVAYCSGGALSIGGSRVKVDARKCVRCGYCGARCPEFCIKVV